HHRLLVVLQLEEAKHAPAALVQLVEGMIDLSADPADHPLAAQGEEVLGLAVLEVGIELAVEEEAALELQRRDPGGASVQAVRKIDETPQLAPLAYGDDAHACHEVVNLHSAHERDSQDPRRRLREGTQPRPARAVGSGQAA